VGDEGGAVVGGARRPDVAAGDRGDAPEHVEVAAGRVGAWQDPPCVVGAVPVLDERLALGPVPAAGRVGVADGPDVAGPGGRHAEELAVAAGCRAGDQGPVPAVPVQRQRLMRCSGSAASSRASRSTVNDLSCPRSAVTSSPGVATVARAAAARPARTSSVVIPPA
jgi:hypothetical protein